MPNKIHLDKGKIKILYILNLILLFLPAFAFYLFDRTYRCFFITLIPTVLFFIFMDYKKIIKKYVYLYKKTVFKYYVFFIIYAITSSILMSTLEQNSFTETLSYLFQFFFLYIIPCFILSSYVIPKYFSLKNFIKFYFIALFFILAFGVIDFIGKAGNIDFIINLQQFLANERVLKSEAVNASIVSHLRASSVFAEPGWFGFFIFFNFPIIYYCCRSKYKIFKSNLLNLILKKSLIPLAWLDIILTISPIWPIICIIQGVIIFYKQIAKILFSKKILYIMIGLCLFIIFANIFLHNLPIENSPVDRIKNTLSSFMKLENFVLMEPSLANRIVCYVVLLRVWLNHFFFGVGLSNAPNFNFHILYNSNLPITLEIFRQYKHALLTGKLYTNGSVFYTLLSETGIIGAVLYYTFIYKFIKLLNKILKYLPDNMIKTWGQGFSASLVSFIFVTIYDAFLANPFIWFMFGIVFSYYEYLIRYIYPKK